MPNTKIVSHNPPRMVFFDIESTNLKASFGLTLCVGYMEMNDEEPKVPSLLDFERAKRDHRFDRDLLAHVSQELAKADCWVTYNGINFDLPFLQTRLLKHGLQPLPPVPHVDLYYLVKHKLRLHRSSLATVTEFYDLDHRKTNINFDDWFDATMGCKSAMKQVVEHCKLDVLVLREAYLKLRSLFVRHPRIHGYGPCQVCGSLDLEKRGYAITKLRGTKQRIHCRKCGSWENRTMNKQEQEFWNLKKGKDFIGLTWE